MFVFNIDRGGTFTDFYVQTIRDKSIVKEDCFKVPSVSERGEGPIMGIRDFMVRAGLMHSEDPKIPVAHIQSINIGTTIATNALLERKGSISVMIVSQGFKDCLALRTQARPDIFDLRCECPAPLTHKIIEVDSRIYTTELKGRNLNLKKVGDGLFYQPPSQESLNRLLERLKELQPASIAVSLCNSYLSDVGERELEEYLRGNGFGKVEKGSAYREMGYLKRTETASLDAFLNPSIQHYFSGLLNHFNHPEEIKFRVMKSDGGFTSPDGIRASNMLLSGPAGGLIGYARMTDFLKARFGVDVAISVGLDMGGTSTDVSKVKGEKLGLKYSFEAEGLEICTPHLEIETIAAGGGSKLGFSKGILSVGPESVGSNPGPACYGIGEQLALTDANLLLNRIDPAFFPKVFGKDRRSGINRQLSVKAFEVLAQEIDSQYQIGKSIHQIAEGFIKVANQIIAKSARKILTLGKPDILISFGSAAGQHCCDVGDKIGVKNIFIHRFSGILSAYGMSKAYETKEEKIFIGQVIHADTFDFDQLRKMALSKRDQHPHLPPSSSSKAQYDQIIQQLQIGYVGTSYTLKVPFTCDALHSFEKQHKEDNGFLLPQKLYRVEYLIENYVTWPAEYHCQESSCEIEDHAQYLLEMSEVFFGGRFHTIGKYGIDGMRNCVIEGPALLLSSTSSIFVNRLWKALVLDGNVRLCKDGQECLLEEGEGGEGGEQMDLKSEEKTDPIKLTIYSTRLMGIAQQMGKVLRKTSISTNIKERLDFSCGIFDSDGSLLANAPHLPVHLGSMEVAVSEQVKRGIKAGDVILSNHPAAGGSHLPDLTVISCFQLRPGTNFFVASRGHHADIGGITPGSMPPFSKFLHEEGVAVEKFILVREGEFLEQETRSLFASSRRVNDNISDLVAQISANQMGMKLIRHFFRETGHSEFHRYVKLICENARHCVEELLVSFSLRNGFPEVHSISNEEYMDDGTPIRLNLVLDRRSKRVLFDFTGTGPEVLGNTNTPKSITRSAVLYCLRSLIGKDIPLNSGCLKPVDILIPEYSILNPSKDCAVVGGNVETSQKLVDLILKPFNYVACSQGTMNNFLFGNSKYSYYETICGGSGAGDGFCGKTVQCHMTNTRITDLEYLERNYPVVLTKFEKRVDSGGRGRFKGGEGVIREVLFLEPMEVSILSERRIFGAYGLQGGQSGEVGHNYLITKEGVRKYISSKSHFLVDAYDCVRIETPGGGGYGEAVEKGHEQGIV